jgi:K+/H+ antiporter YhaU regulatory subunit KhtT
VKASWDTQVRELQQIVADLKRLNDDQDRIRKNLRETPKEAEVYTVYLKKLSDQEKEIDGLTAKQKKLMGEEFAARKKFEDYLANISD